MANTNTVTLNLAVKFSDSVAADINTTWEKTTAGAPGTLASDMASGDTQFSLVAGAPLNVAYTPALLMIGSSLRIDDEIMAVTGINGSTISVVRGVSPDAPATPHSLGATIYVLVYATPFQMIADLALRPWAQGVVASLGAKSATFGATATGTITAD